jgi:hypothetical protein
MKISASNIIHPVAATNNICAAFFTTTTGMMMGRMSMA